MTRFCLILLFLAFSKALLFAQTDSTLSVSGQEKLFVVKTVAGAEYLAKVLSDDGREVFLETNTVGKLYLKKSEIISMQQVVNKADVADKVEQGHYKKPFKPQGIFTTRYVITTNALPIKKGENYAMTNFHGPEIHFSVTDRFNAGIMTTWIGSPIILAFKYTLSDEEDTVKYALGTLLGSSGFLWGGRGYMGLHWVTATRGNRESNLSGSLGYAYFGLGDNLIHGPMLGLAGVHKVGDRASFVMDNMFLFGFDNTAYQSSITGVPGFTFMSMIMPGLRFQSSEKSATQIALPIVSKFGSGNTFAFPLPMLTLFFKL